MYPALRIKVTTYRIWRKPSGILNVKSVRLKMSPEDKEYLRALYAGFKSVTGADVEECFRFADAMIEQLEPREEGIVKARKKRVPII
jgi:hypothetical protein